MPSLEELTEPSARTIVDVPDAVDVSNASVVVVSVLSPPSKRSLSTVRISKVALAKAPEAGGAATVTLCAIVYDSVCVFAGLGDGTGSRVIGGRTNVCENVPA